MTKSAIHLHTIGVYGFTEDSFFEELKNADIDTFCDLRARRGVRGSEYAFANSKRLQSRLIEMGIAYFHFPELAPEKSTRIRQYEKDKEMRVTKRQRKALSGEFIEDYTKTRLQSFDSVGFIEGLGHQARNIVLFCVERDPAACHRSLVADRLQSDLHIDATHLR